MAGGQGTGISRSLQETPTWALATVCFVFIFFGVFIEHLIHLLCHWLKKHRKTALFEAVERLKSVLILLGFMSLLLAVTQRPISKICIQNRVAYSMLPCRRSVSTKTIKGYEHFWTTEDEIPLQGRELAGAGAGADSSSDHCGSRGMTSFISQDGINQLNIFIFVLAVMQIVYSVLTMALGSLKMKRWKSWEEETQTIEYMTANDPKRFRLTRETTFGRRHMRACTDSHAELWIKCFFRQFFYSVAKVDYLTLRHGFISAHLSTNNSFNFQKYIQRSLDEDFKEVVGISPFMWLIVVCFLLVDVHGWNAYLWVSFLPLITVLVIGTKLEVIVAKMALQIKEKNSVIQGTPLVQPNDNLFWFNQPRFVLTLLHFTLFMNAFELAFFIWVTLQFGIKSCYHESVEIIVIRLTLAVTVQVLCSYITLPLYALVTQMGSHFKSAVLDEQVADAIKQLHSEVKKKRKKRAYNHSESAHDYSSSTTNTTSIANSPDISSHHRTPTLSEFPQTQTDEIIEQHAEQLVEEKEASLISSPSDGIRIQMPDVSSAPK